MQSLGLNPCKKAAALGALSLIPVLLVLSALRGDKNYALLSVVVITAAMVPFFLSFEKRSPQARELVAIAVMAGLAALGRVAFAPIPNFKPITAIIIIAGVAFGPEAGFLTGAVAAATSNLFFGQGPWTPWQMFCWGMIGLGAGLLRNNGFLRGKYSLAAYGLLSGFVFGWIMNLWYIIGFISPITWQAIITAYISSFWFDLTHALSTLVFVFVLAAPWLKKLNRIKIKFGLLE